MHSPVRAELVEGLSFIFWKKETLLAGAGERQDVTGSP